MSLTTIRAGIKTKLESLTDINKVLDYIVWSDDWQVLYDKFSIDGRFDTWMIQLNNTPQFTVSSQDKNITWNFNIIGYYSILTDDESSKVFETNIETILNGFGVSKNVLGLAGVTNTSPILVSTASTVFNTTPAHTAVIQMSFNEISDQALECGDGT